MEFNLTSEKLLLWLEEMGFHILKEEQYIVEYIKERLIVGIGLDDYSYEISAYFAVEGSADRVSLQSALDYFNITEFNGLYQLPSLDKISLGLDYMLEPIKEIVTRLGETYGSVMTDIMIWYEDTRKERLEEYYFETDMEQAEKYWKEKDYDKAKELYLKNKEKLSEIQMKKLDYIMAKEAN